MHAAAFACTLYFVPAVPALYLVRSLLSYPIMFWPLLRLRPASFALFLVFYALESTKGQQ
jgi:hypothetical protein